MEPKLFPLQRPGNEIGNHDLSMPVFHICKWSHKIDQPCSVAAFPFCQSQAIFTIQQPMLKLALSVGIAARPKRQANWLCAITKNIERFPIIRVHTRTI